MIRERKLAILQDTQEDFVRVYCPFNRQWLALFKARIPPTDREPIFHRAWDGRMRWDYWKVRKLYLNEVVALLQEFFGEEIETDLYEEEQGVFDQLFSLIPDGRVDTAFKLLARIFHPDAGGEEELFVRLKKSYEKRKEERW